MRHPGHPQIIHCVVEWTRIAGNTDQRRDFESCQRMESNLSSLDEVLEGLSGEERAKAASRTSNT